MKFFRVPSCLAPGPSSSLPLAETADTEQLLRTRTRAEVAPSGSLLAAPWAGVAKSFATNCIFRKPCSHHSTGVSYLLQNVMIHTK